jgi:hypothetical protein
MTIYLKIKRSFLFALALQICLSFSALSITKQNTQPQQSGIIFNENKGQIYDQHVKPHYNSEEFYTTAQAPILKLVNSLEPINRTFPLNASNNYKALVSNLTYDIYYVVLKYGDRTIKEKIIVAE